MLDNICHYGILVFIHVAFCNAKRIKYPNTRQSEIVNGVVSNLDIMPTVLDVVDDKIPNNVQGQSLRNLNSLSSRTVFSESYPNKLLGSGFLREERAIISDCFKFINSSTGKKEFYNLSEDANEKINLYNADDGICKGLEAKLNEWLKTTVEKTEPSNKLNEETLSRLKALGYM